MCPPFWFAWEFHYRAAGPPDGALKTAVAVDAVKKSTLKLAISGAYFRPLRMDKPLATYVETTNWKQNFNFHFIQKLAGIINSDQHIDMNYKA